MLQLIETRLRLLDSKANFASLCDMEFIDKHTFHPQRVVGLNNLRLDEWCVREFKVANDTAGRDLRGLTELGLLKAQGKGRGVRYLAISTDNRPTEA